MAESDENSQISQKLGKNVKSRNTLKTSEPPMDEEEEMESLYKRLENIATPKNVQEEQTSDAEDNTSTRSSDDSKINQSVDEYTDEVDELPKDTDVTTGEEEMESGDSIKARVSTDRRSQKSKSSIIPEDDSTTGPKIPKSYSGRVSFIRTTGGKLEEPTWLGDLRSYNSEPALQIRFGDKFWLPKKVPVRPPGVKRVARKNVSAEDVYIVYGEHKELNKEEGASKTPNNNNDKPSSYEMDQKMIDLWTELGEMEKTRFSFFDELVAQGIVFEKLEVPKNGNDVDDLISAMPNEFRKGMDYGRVQFHSGQVYIGNFADFHFHGPGRYVWTNGTIYQGDFYHGMLHGKGAMFFPDGSLYEGEFQNSARTGWGVFTSSEGYTYAGFWQDNLPMGKGKMWYDPQDDATDYYDGEWDAGLQHGFGVRQYSNGDRYIGQWDKGIRKGKGTMIWLSDRQVRQNKTYKGEWDNGVPHGEGRHIWYLTRTPCHNFPTRHVYQGQFFEGHRDGIGKMIYPCGSSYEGKWKNGQRHGKGVFVNPAGDILLGLFRAGSIMGGADVPLHSPTYECDFGGLVEWVTAKLGLSVVNEGLEEENLSYITLRFLTEIRTLYNRAGELAHSYANNGLYPAWCKEKVEEPTDFIDEEPPHMKARTTKPPTLDNVHAVTRFGLWLLLKDCPSVLNDVSMAHFDKLWEETPSISFQTLHNPFEPVYLWQFLQCLILVAVTIYMEIPERKKRLAELEAILKQSKNKKQKQDTDIESIMEGGSNMETNSRQSVSVVDSSIMDSSNASPQRPRSPHEIDGATAIPKSPSMTKLYSAPHKGHLKSMGGKNSKKAYSQSTSTMNEAKPKSSAATLRLGSASMPLKGATADAQKGENSARKRVKSKKGKNVTRANQTKVEKDKLASSSNNKLPTTAKIKSKLAPRFEEEPSLESLEDTEEFHSIGKHFTCTISEAFERFLIEKLIPCLEKKPGLFLPSVPKPLPPLADLFSSFNAMAEKKEVMSAREFIHNMLPHLARPNSKIWWHRSPELLSPFINLETLFSLYHTNLINRGKDVQELGEQFLGDALENPHIFSASLKREARHSFVGSDEKSATALITPKKSKGSVFGSTVKMVQRDENGEHQINEHDSLTDFCTESTPFSEEDLLPEPFLWDSELKCKQVERNLSTFKKLSSHDVLNVFRYMYPKLCGQDEENTNIDFDIIFCDWLWCISLCAKVSADREFGKIMTVGNPALGQNMPQHHHVLPNPLFTGVYAHDVRRINNMATLRENENEDDGKCRPMTTA